MGTTWRDPLVWRGLIVNYQGHTDATTSVPTFTLVNGVVTYVNFPMVDAYYENDKIGLYKTDGTAVVTMKAVSSVISDGFDAYAGKLIRFGVLYDGVAYE